MIFGEPKYYGEEAIYGTGTESLKSPKDVNAGNMNRKLRDIWIRAQQEEFSENLVDEFIQVSRNIFSSYDTPQHMGARAGDQKQEHNNTVETSFLDYIDLINNEIERDSIPEDYREEYEEVNRLFKQAVNASGSAYLGTTSTTNKTVYD